MPFSPHYVYFEKNALDYPLGKELFHYFQQKGQEISFTDSHNRIRGLPGNSPQEKFVVSKKTLVVGVRKTLNFPGCKPSAHYQLPLVTGCPGLCEYCYLHTTLGSRPYLRLYVNIDEILQQVHLYINERLPETTYFEGSATSDPLSVEQLGGSLGKAIDFFARTSQGHFRFATKQVEVEPLLKINHKGHTRVRFSINTGNIIKKFEKGTPPLQARIKGGRKILQAGYPLGFLVAPIFIFSGWQEEYRALFASLAEEISPLLTNYREQLTFEFVTHRFTPRAQKNITTLYPETQLPMDKSERKFKYGQFGYGKYIYPPETMEEIKEFFKSLTDSFFPTSRVEYIV